MGQRGSLLLSGPFSLLEKWSKITEPEHLSPTPPTVPSTPVRMISVIIPAHNEEGYLSATLEALQCQDYRWFETIVVANGCTDRTPEIARGQCQRLIVLSRKNLGMARNLGARMARGELLLFLDADTILDPSALRRIAEEFTSNDAAGTVRGEPDSPRFAYRFIYGLKNFLHRSSLHPGSSGVILCWKEHFVRTGGFDEALEVRENSHLLKRLKRFGKYKYLHQITATTSMRRYQQRGLPRVVLLWIKLWLESQLGDLRQHRYETVR